MPRAITRRKKQTVYYLLALITAGFLLLTLFVYLDPLSGIDREFSEEIQEHRNVHLDNAMRLISWFGYMPNSVFLVLATALLFFILKYKREALYVLCTLLTGVVSSLIKLIVNRPRPMPSLVRIMEKTSQQSFPSGHVSFYIVFFGFLILLMYRLPSVSKFSRRVVASVCLILIFTVPVSRIYLGAHWFTDVLAGLLLGILCLYSLAYFYLSKEPPKT
jgi:membrane-associated phospholipid phosphatase